MKRVIVSYGDKMILANNIESALLQIFDYTDKSNASKPEDESNIMPKHLKI